MKKLMLGLMMAFAVTAEAEEVIDGIIYAFNFNGTATITGYTGSPKSVDVAEVEWEEQKYTVTSVGMNAFGRCPSLTSASLPNATTIGKDAFRGCENLKEAYLPNATTIGESAFDGCEELTSVSLPNATTIGKYAFYQCGLTSVSLSLATTIGEQAFSQCGSLTSVSLPNATTIGENAFQQCGSLTSVYLPNATTIERNAFWGCEKLASVSLPNATTIGGYAFYQCPKLEKIIVNAPMAMELKNNKDFYEIPAGCKILPEYCVVKPHSAEHTTAKVYTDGAEVTSNPIVVASNATVEVVFTADYSYCFKDYTTVQTNTFTATDDPTEVDGPETIRNLVVTVKLHPAEHSTAKVYTDGAEVTSNPIEVVSNATVEVVFTAEEGYCFEDDHSTARTNTVEATDDPTEVDGPTVVKIPSLEEDDVRKAEWEAETTVSVSTALKSGDKTLDKGEYEYACEFYGVEVKAEPTEADFKVVSKDTQVVQEDEIVVKKESIQAAKAETISVADGVVTLNVNVCSNGNFTAETSSWEKTKITDVKLNDDGTVTLTVPVSSASAGFMILQSKDAKVNNVPNIIIEDR